MCTGTQNPEEMLRAYMYHVAWQLSQSDMYGWVDRSAVKPWRPVSACPEGHPLPTRPTRWFDGVAWRDGREACRHCYEARAAMDRLPQ